MFRRFDDVTHTRIQPFEWIISPLFAGDAPACQKALSDFMLEHISSSTITERSHESTYQAMVFVLLIAAQDQGYHVSIERETHYGRCDVLIYRDPDNVAVIIRLKTMTKKESNGGEIPELVARLRSAAEGGIEQIKEKKC